MSVVNPVVAGTPAQASQFNGLLAAWDDYTPSASNFTVGNGSLTGKYYRQGKSIFVRINFTAGSSSGYTSSALQVTLPVNAHSTGEQRLLVHHVAPGLGAFVGSAQAAGSFVQPYSPSSTSNCSLAPLASTTSNPGTSGSFVIEGIYEAA